MQKKLHMKYSNNLFNKESHQKFVEDSDSAIKQLFKKVSDKRRSYLDFSPDSLQELDALLRELKKGHGTEDNPLDIKEKDHWWIVRIAYYFAEVLKRNLGGHWEYGEDESSKFYRSSYISINKNTKKIDPLLQVAASWQYGESLFSIYEYISSE